ncbi:MAG TPA: primosomal protein N' [Candidatus Borkfalkia excrementavium]|uniref:Replication restart protein PriA n=1 Tax=Candidatus Borkfalkia excrementavium TaxID=2838505 RepID=A0A9D1Z8N1_9FIRM|nr:primosomal protein N' [Candidatus Borkfalkia excrementavium]
MTAEVIVDIAHGEVDRIFEYRAIDGVCEGSRVKVPFGNRVVDGFVMRLKRNSDFDAAKLKSILSVVDEVPALCAECLSLAEQISVRYRCPKALVLRLFLPGEMRKGAVRELYKTYVLLKDGAFEPAARAKAQAAALAFLRENGKYGYTELCGRFGRSAVGALVEKGAAELTKERVIRSPYVAVSGAGAEHTLTAGQKSAVESIGRSDKTVQLLHGVTGSGKTEIYLTLIADQLQKGKSAIFLVPEISLTPQMLSQLRARFGPQAAILHSGLSAGERFDEWWRLRTGEAKIAVGARSAVFAPVENIGVIILDEEHDGSYFSESNPRYSTLEIAKMRAEYNGCKLVAGSATPSVETYLKATQGEYNLIRLPERINRKPMPEIAIADMRREVRRGNNSAFSAALREELAECLEQKKQAILFLNRRGYAQSVVCRECGYVAKCEACDVSLTYHSEENCLKCHYCGAQYRMLSACPECGGVHLSYTGTGTQKIVGELKKMFPSARILRMDNDTTSGKEGHYKILKQFADRKADILVGTQMIAKGHDFPAVTLVGILDADMSLHFSDYRSGERTFQLITQVAGRSGRAEEQGKVVLQTYDPENYILRFAIRYDYEGFFRHEISLRKSTAFPPFAKIVRVMVTASEDADALEALRAVYFALKEIYEAHREDFLFFNKMKSPIKKIQNKFRYQVLMRVKNDALLPEIYEKALACPVRGALVYIEENPANLS